jgi:hypothetical protein
MSSDLVFQSEPQMRALASRLAECPDVVKWDSEESHEAWNLAYALGEIEKQCATLVNELFPKLSTTQPASCDETMDLLFDIGDTLRFILYEVKESKFYQPYYI